MDLRPHARTLERGEKSEKLLVIEDLAGVGGVKAAGLLTRALPHEQDPEVATAIVQVLGRMGLKRNLPALEKALNSDLAFVHAGQPTDTLARAVLDALASQAGPTSLPALIRYFDNPRADRNTLGTCAHLLAALGEAGEFHVLKRALDLHSPLWSHAVQALDAPRFRVHASALAALLPDANAHQALLIIRALGAMGARDHATAVRQALVRGVIQDPLEKRDAEAVLARLERPVRGRERRVATVRRTAGK